MPFWSSNRVKDPVCGMDVDPKKTSHTFEHAGKTYYFCSPGCRANFVKEPAKYLKAATQSSGGPPMSMGHH